jgi:hypothetical protein
MYTPENVSDIDEFKNHKIDAKLIAAILNHVEYMIVNQDDWICDGCGDVNHPCMPCQPDVARGYAQTKKVSARTLAAILADHRHRSDGSVKSSLVPDCITEERTVVPTDLEKELALAYERCHKAEAKIIELQMELDKLKQVEKPDDSVMFLYGNHSTYFFDSADNCSRWLNRLTTNVIIRNVEMVSYRGANLHLCGRDTDTHEDFIKVVTGFLYRNKDSK